MPDITMCLLKACSVSKRCYRFKAKPDREHQSYFADKFPCKLGYERFIRMPEKKGKK